MSANLANEIGVAGVKAAPPITIAAASATGWGVQEWMYAATLVYVVAQLGYLLWKWQREWRGRRGGQ